MTINTDQEYILCAAIWYNRLTPNIIHQPKNVHTGFVLCGHRHHNVIQIGAELAGLRLKERDVQGFITSKNRFVDRKEAYIIAIKSGQIQSPSAEDELKDLYSEDLY
jgi:hypothetical protein